MSHITRLLAIAIFCLLGGCSISSLMFYPLKPFPATPDQLGVVYEPVHHQASDGTQLVSWWLPAIESAEQKPKGTVVFLHGNAQNISYHQLNVNWLPNQGFNVFMLGYRQFGQSDGIAKLPNIFLDVHAALDWVRDRVADEPIFILGQSMGATLAVFGLASYEFKGEVDGVVLDAAFDSYPGMAATAMSRNWFTWPLSIPAYLITDDYDPIDWITEWPQLPLLMMHSPVDQVVPYEKGRSLYEHAMVEKRWIDSEGAHIATFGYEHLRLALIEFLQEVSKTRQ